MAGSRDLSYLLRNMNPVLNEGEFVFCSVQDSTSSSTTAILLFAEEEGTSVILRRSDAEALSLEYAESWAWITLNVHSDLSAVGFLAEVTKALASQSISCNVISAFYHDHLFVPYSKGPQALRILKNLSE